MRPLPPLVLLLFLMAMVTVRFAWPEALLLSFPLTLLGLAPLAAGVWLNLSADQALKKAATTVKPFEESAALVTAGPYARSRHPMYLGMVLLLLGVALLLGSTPGLALVPVFALVAQRGYIRAEERMLETRFGREWQDYRATVRPWIQLAGVRRSGAPRPEPRRSPRRS